eukprot:3276310-Heterocapsa_arctica.AAC.1
MVQLHHSGEAKSASSGGQRMWGLRVGMPGVSMMLRPLIGPQVPGQPPCRPGAQSSAGVYPAASHALARS